MVNLDQRDSTEFLGSFVGMKFNNEIRGHKLCKYVYCKKCSLLVCMGTKRLPSNRNKEFLFNPLRSLDYLSLISMYLYL